MNSSSRTVTVESSGLSKSEGDGGDSVVTDRHPETAAPGGGNGLNLQLSLVEECDSRLSTHLPQAKVSGSLLPAGAHSGRNPCEPGM